ncbi:MAG: FG-GAP repeat domain-containing protein [Planctomycetota bacterium]
MKNNTLLTITFLLLAVPAWSQPFTFRHHLVDPELPGSAWGQTALVDLDGDGDLDFITGKSGGNIRWYEYEDDQTWVMHVIGENSPSEVGGAALDVDRDGRLDFVTGGAWYRQPENAKATPWPRFVFDETLKGVHDVSAADATGDGFPEVFTMSDRNDLRYYVINKDNPGGSWPHERIGDSVHAGLSVGDLDADGDIDVVRSQVWFENINNGSQWKVREFCGIPWADRKQPSFSYLASKSCVADINGDGRNDIVLTEAEFSGAKVAWFEAPENPHKSPWTPHVLPQTDPEHNGPFHSLAVADFDNDGDLDIFSGEMERFGVKPHRWFIWENVSGDGKTFKTHIVFDGNLGTHDAVAGDIDGDGDIDIMGKLWQPVGDNANQGNNHVDFLENRLIK